MDPRAPGQPQSRCRSGRALRVHLSERFPPPLRRGSSLGDTSSRLAAFSALQPTRGGEGKTVELSPAGSWRARRTSPSRARARPPTTPGYPAYRTTTRTHSLPARPASPATIFIFGHGFCPGFGAAISQVQFSNDRHRACGVALVRRAPGGSCCWGESFPSECELSSGRLHELSRSSAVGSLCVGATARPRHHRRA